jgi:hypothetical protein
MIDFAVKFRKIGDVTHAKGVEGPPTKPRQNEEPDASSTRGFIVS